MDIVDNIILPILQLILYVFMLGCFCFLIYLFVKKKMPNLRYRIKYGIPLFKKKFDEKKVKFCIYAKKNEMDKVEIKRRLLLEGASLRDIGEIIYIFKRIAEKEGKK